MRAAGSSRSSTSISGRDQPTPAERFAVYVRAMTSATLPPPSNASAPDDRGPNRRPPSPPPNGGAVYGLGIIGALVWFWRDADGAGGRALAVLKAVVWPAILVHDAFAFLRRPSPSTP